MLLFHSIRALSSFWEFGEMVFLIPAALVIALLLQAVIFRNQRRPWLPIAVIGFSHHSQAGAGRSGRRVSGHGGGSVSAGSHYRPCHRAAGQSADEEKGGVKILLP